MTIDEFLEGAEGRYVSFTRGECTLRSVYSLTVAIGYGATAQDSLAHALAVYEVRRSLERKE
jgi:hypothetical protein